MSRIFPTPVDIKNRIYMFITTLLIMASLILWAVDYQHAGSLSWSWIPNTVLLSTFLFLTTLFTLYKSFLKLSFGLLGSTVFLLGTLNYLTGSQWFLPLGLPIILSLQVLFTLSYYLIKHFSTKGYNIFGVVLLSIALFCLMTDGLVHLYWGKWDLSWSIITSFSLTPISFYFLFLHYGLNKALDLTRTFHF